MALSRQYLCRKIFYWFEQFLSYWQIFSCSANRIWRMTPPVIAVPEEEENITVSINGTEHKGHNSILCSAKNTKIDKNVSLFNSIPKVFRGLS